MALVVLPVLCPLKAWQGQAWSFFKNPSRGLYNQPELEEAGRQREDLQRFTSATTARSLSLSLCLHERQQKQLKS